MDKIYTKTILYAYAHLDKVVEQIDELVLKNALSSMTDYSPALNQCERIVDLSMQKETIITLKEKVKKAIGVLSLLELDHLDYKYFKVNPKSYYKNFDSSSRAYFRRQVSLLRKVGLRLEKVGISDSWFIENCLIMNFFVELVRRVKEYEKKVG